MTRHTPGPWEARPEDGIGVRGFRISPQSQRKLVAQTAGFRQKVGRQEEQANAHLIAAAPELLAGLQSFLASYHAGGIPPRSVVEVAERAVMKALVESGEERNEA